MTARAQWIADAAAAAVGAGLVPALVPVVREIDDAAGDPVALLSRLARGPFAFLLESAAGGGRYASYTFLGTEPREAWRYAGTRVDRWTAADGWQPAGATPDPIGHIGGLMRSHRPPARPDLPPFSGGAVGYLGYDIVRTLERLPAGANDDLGVPDAIFLIADLLVVVDKNRDRATIIVTVAVPAGASEAERGALYDAACARGEDCQSRLQGPRSLAPVGVDEHAEPAVADCAWSDDDFMAGVRTLKEHIAAGDIFQGVLSRRIEVPGTVDPLHLYRCMRAMNPAPYLFYLKLDDFALVGGSPEMLVRVDGTAVTVRPIAGTRPRGATPERDAVLAAELLADPKERAEHLMLVDLGRNDVGRVAAFGTVRVVESMALERYTHVQHIVSEVRGTLAPGKDAVDALKACFPAGTVTGAPKVRAMEILARLEPVRRGPYAGAVGYLGWGAGQLDTAITIRTCLVLGDRVIVQAGAGIVADSEPSAELAETQHKARGALRAVALARQTPGC